MGFKTYFTGLSVPEKLFGTGYNSFGIYIMTYFADIIPENFKTAFLIPHNFVLQSLFETGLFGFAGYVSIYGRCIYSGLKNRTETSVICFFAVAVYLVSMLFYVPSPEVTVPVILFLAALCPAKNKSLRF